MSDVLLARFEFDAGARPKRDASALVSAHCGEVSVATEMLLVKQVSDDGRALAGYA
jgi:hypothetical protein